MHKVSRIFIEAHNRDVIAQLIQHGLQWKNAPAAQATSESGLIFSGKTFVLTGTLSTMTREQAKNRIEQQGGKVTASVSSVTSYVVVGTDPGSKYTRATELGIPVLDEDQLLSLLQKQSE